MSETLGTEFADDMLQGADAIAKFLYKDGKKRRKVYHLVATSRFPSFKLGSVICARKSVLLQWIKDQEDRNAGESNKAKEASIGAL